MKRWNKDIDEPTLSMYLGLLAINEAALKECFLRGGVLIQDDDGSWSLADDYKSL